MHGQLNESGASGHGNCGKYNSLLPKWYPSMPNKNDISGKGIEKTGM